MAEQTIDRLSIELDANAGNAGQGMDKLAASIERLRSSVNSADGPLGRMIDKFKALNDSIVPFKSKFEDLSPALTRFKKSMSELSNINLDGLNMRGLVDSLNPLKELPGSAQDIKAFSSGLNSLTRGLERVQSVDVGSVGSNVRNLVAALRPLGNEMIRAGAGLSNYGDQVKSFASAARTLSGLNNVATNVNGLIKAFRKLGASDLDQIEKTISRLATVLKPLTDEMIRGSKAANAYSRVMGKLRATPAQKMSNQTSMAFTRIGKSADFATPKVKELRDKLTNPLRLANFAGAVYLFKQGFDVIKGLVNNIGGYIEDVNLFSVSLGKAAGEASKLAKKMYEVLGVDAGEFMRNMGFFNQMATSFGLASNKAYILGKNLTQLAFDMTSFYNLTSTEQAFQKLRSGIAGEVEPLRALGIDVSNARLQQELYALGIDRTVASLSQADKAQLRYLAILKQTVSAQGDLARTLDSPLNQLRRLQAEFQNTARAIGSIFLPAIQRIIPYVTATVKFIGILASQVAAFLGFEMPKFETPEMPNFGDISGGLDDVTGSANKADKALNHLIGGFDELNILSKSTKDSGLDGAGDILGGIELPEYDPFQGLEGNDKVNEILQKLLDTFDKLKIALGPTIEALKRLWDQLKIIGGFAWQGLKDFYEHFLKPVGAWVFGEGLPRFIDALTNGLAKVDWQRINDSLKKLWDALAPFAINIGEGLLWFWENVLVPLGTWTMNEVVPRFIDTLAESIKSTNEIIDKSKPAWKALWDNFLNPLAKYTGGKMLEVFDHLTERLRKLFDTVKESKVFEDLVTVFEKLSPVLSPVAELLVDIAARLAKFLIDTRIANIEYAFKQAKDAIGAVADILNGDFMGALEHVFDFLIGNKIEKIASYFGFDDLDISESLGKVTEQIAEWFENSVMPWFTLEKWQELLSSIGIGISEAVEDFKRNWIGPIESWWDENVSPWFTLSRWEELLYNIGLAMGDAVKKFVGFWTETIPNWWTENVEPWFHLERWQKLLSSIATSIQEAVAKFKENWITPISNWWTQNVEPWFHLDRWVKMLSSIGTSIKTAVSEFVTNWTAKITDWWNNSVKIWFTLERWQELGKSAIQGLLKGLEGLKDKALSLGGSFLQGFKDALGIASPSKEMESAGGYLNAGLENGITGSLQTIKSAVSALVQAVSGPMNELSKTMNSTFSSAMSNLAQTTTRAMQSLSTGVSQSMRSMESSVSSAVNSISGSLSRLSSQISRTMRELDNLSRKERSASYSGYDVYSDYSRSVSVFSAEPLTARYKAPITAESIGIAPATFAAPAALTGDDTGVTHVPAYAKATVKTYRDGKYSEQGVVEGYQREIANSGNGGGNNDSFLVEAIKKALMDLVAAEYQMTNDASEKSTDRIVAAIYANKSPDRKERFKETQQDARNYYKRTGAAPFPG